MKAANIGKWPPDVLRHTFASAHYAFHRDPARTAVILGHRDQNMLLTSLPKFDEAKRSSQILDDYAQRIQRKHRAYDWNT